MQVTFAHTRRVAFDGVLAEVLPPTSAEILHAFGLRVGDLRRHGLGWDSVGWTDGVWFVKVWRYRPPANLPLLEQLELGVSVPVAQQTLDGESFAVTAEGSCFGVFRFLGGRHAVDDDWRETARVLRLVHDHPAPGLPTVTLVMNEWDIVSDLRERLDHPWIRDRRLEVEHYLNRLEAVTEEALRHPSEPVLLHNDFGGSNLLLDDAGVVSAILDWDHACIGPREHDMRVAFVHPDPPAFLRAYGAENVSRVHLEHALLRRATEDLTARVVEETDREGVVPWGFDRWHRLDSDLESALPFLAS